MRLFAFPLGVSALTLIGALILGGPNIALTLLVLTVLEVSLSFDNAVINAMWLHRMNAFWQRMFLTVGILVAVFGMRLVFPVVVVAIAAGISIAETIDLAINDSVQYAHVLEGSHHSIATFGAVFLGMIFLDWMFEERDIKWLGPVERLFSKLGKVDYLAVATMLVLLLVVAPQNLVAGIAALVTYLGVSILSDVLENHAEEEETNGSNIKTVTATGGFGAFMYLEMMDASFSFDGVMAAFAISTSIAIIALGLGNGAVYIRTMTVYLTRKGTLQDLVHLEHGAHYAIGCLAALMFTSLHLSPPEVVGALLSLTAIGVSILTSLRVRNAGREEPVIHGRFISAFRRQ